MDPIGHWPPAMVIGLVATVFWATAVTVLGGLFIRAWSRRSAARNAPEIPPDVTARLARIEAAVDSIAVEVERISENQRFLTRLQAGQQPSSTGERLP